MSKINPHWSHAFFHSNLPSQSLLSQTPPMLAIGSQLDGYKVPWKNMHSSKFALSIRNWLPCFRPSVGIMQSLCISFSRPKQANPLEKNSTNIAVRPKILPHKVKTLIFSPFPLSPNTGSIYRHAFVALKTANVKCAFWAEHFLYIQLWTHL